MLLSSRALVAEERAGSIMSRKRSRGGGVLGGGGEAREGGWDALPWRAIEPPIEVQYI